MSGTGPLYLLAIFACGFVVGSLLAALPALLRIRTHVPSSRAVLSRDVYNQPPGGAEGQQQAETTVNYSSDTRSFLRNWSSKDDTSMADALFHGVRVLCWVMTGPDNLERRAIHVKRTWGRRCNILLFASDYLNETFPTINITVGAGRENLMAKTTAAFEYAYKHHYNDADWFLKADDDTYVIVENLRYLLSRHDPRRPIFFGHHYHIGSVHVDYFSGGGGYVVSKEALTRFHHRHTYKPRRDVFGGHCVDNMGAEDAEFGKCMAILGVKMGDSRDTLGRTRFHCFVPGAFLLENYPPWYYDYDKHGAAAGIGSMSDYAVTFHYVDPVVDMYKLDFLIYDIKVYGVVAGMQEINGPPKHNYTDVPIKERVNIKQQVHNISQACNRTIHNRLEVYAC